MINKTKFYKKFKKKKLMFTQKINIFVKLSSNNIIILAQYPKNKNFIVTGGLAGFKGAKRSTAYAAQQASELLGKNLKKNKINNVFIIFKNFGKARKFIIKGLKKQKINILKLIDKTPLAHNGCRNSKKRRL